MPVPFFLFVNLDFSENRLRGLAAGGWVFPLGPDSFLSPLLITSISLCYSLKDQAASLPFPLWCFFVTAKGCWVSLHFVTRPAFSQLSPPPLTPAFNTPPFFFPIAKFRSSSRIWNLPFLFSSSSESLLLWKCSSLEGRRDFCTRWPVWP